MQKILFTYTGIDGGREATIFTLYENFGCRQHEAEWIKEHL